MHDALRESATRVLVYRLGSIGDFVIALPCLNLVRRRFPSAKIRLLTNLPVDARTTPAMSVLEGTGLVDQFVSYRAATRDPHELWALARDIKTFAPDLLVYLASPRGTWPVYRDYLFFRWCGVRRMVGFPFQRDQRLVRSPRDKNALWEREAERLARCVESLGQADVEAAQNYDLLLSEAERAVADKCLKEAAGSWLEYNGFLGLSIGTKQEANDWGDDNWRTTLAALRSCGLALVLIGSIEDRDRSQRLADRWPEPAINLCGQLSPRVSAAVIRHARAFLCHDSGPMHLAAAVGTPCVAVFSSLNPPGKWYPLGGNHRILYPASSEKSIAAITPRQVIAAATQVLAESQPERLLPGASNGSRER